jgi:catechol 2,3-dioxygenase-like lactoylglutathione lyase family enzyme
MLENARVTPTVAVKDLAAAKEFYGNVLGLKLTDENPAGLFFGGGESRLLVYESPQYAGTNKATYAGWTVDDVPAAVEELKGKGVTFQTFDIPDGTWDGDVASWEGKMQSAWFTDPDGNIFALDSGM